MPRLDQVAAYTEKPHQLQHPHERCRLMKPRKPRPEDLFEQALLEALPCTEPLTRALLEALPCTEPVTRALLEALAATLALLEALAWLMPSLDQVATSTDLPTARPLPQPHQPL